MSIFLLRLGNRTPRNACNPAWHANSQRFQPSYLCPTGRSLRVCVISCSVDLLKSCHCWNSLSTCSVFVLEPDTLSRVYVWVKVRSVSAALLGTHRHLFLPLFQTRFLYIHTATCSGGTPGFFSFLLLVTLLGGKVGHVTCPKSLLAPRRQLDSFLRQLFHFPFDCWQIGSGRVCAPDSRKGFQASELASLPDG